MDQKMAALAIATYPPVTTSLVGRVSPTKVVWRHEILAIQSDFALNGQEHSTNLRGVPA
jgi:hypothetical protein